MGVFGVTEHYNGSKWTIMESVTDYYIRSIWGTSATNIYAVGGDDFSGNFEGNILHYDGLTWSEIYNAEEIYLWDIWGSSPADVFAVGYNGTILHYDGETWSGMDSGATEWLYGVWFDSPTDVFVVGDLGTILHYDGSTWSPMESKTTECLRSIWGSSTTDIFVVGYNGTILHYDGSTWSPMDGGGYDYKLMAVWGNSAANVFATGKGVILHYTEPLSTTTTTASQQPCPAGQLYGENSEETQLMRLFRDNILSNTPEGQEIIKLYYEWTPVIVKAMEEDETFKEAVRAIIDKILPLISAEAE